MTYVSGLPPLEGELDALRARRDALRQAAALPGVKLRPTLEAALAELDGAIEALAAAQDEARDGRDSSTQGVPAEQRLLRAVFADAPVPLFVLERDGTVRRANRAAGELLGTGTGYTTGKPFSAFVNLPSRAAVHTQLATAIRTAAPTQVRCELLTGDGTKEYTLTVGLVQPRGDDDRLIISVTQPLLGSAPAQAAARATSRKGRGKTALNSPAAKALAATTRRLDVATSVTRLLLENATQSEAVTVQRCARLLAQELSAWVIVDVGHGEQMQRRFVTGPEDERSAELASVVAGCDPGPGSVPRTVHDTGKALLIAHADDAGMLGEGPGGVPLLMLLGTTSLLSVPITDGERGYGVLTLARGADLGHFEMADLGLIEELGEQLALAIKVDQMVRWHTKTAQVLRASLLPPELPAVPGVEIATFHHAAARSPEMGGDFYDVYRTRSGWGVSIGDVGGRGENVAAIAAAARHAIRVVGHMMPDSTATLTGANEIMLAEEFGGRFVTACTAHLAWRGSSLRVTLGCAGHPGPVLMRPDGSTHQMRGGGLPLGIFPDADLGMEDLELATGDVLVFYTDGLADIRSPQGDSLGDRLADEITALTGQPPGRILTRLYDLALDFGQEEIRDDMTMLALQVGEPPEPTMAKA